MKTNNLQYLHYNITKFESLIVHLDILWCQNVWQYNNADFKCRLILNIFVAVSVILCKYNNYHMILHMTCITWPYTWLWSHDRTILWFSLWWLLFKIRFSSLVTSWVWPHSITVRNIITILLWQTWQHLAFAFTFVEHALTFMHVMFIPSIKFTSFGNLFMSGRFF